jgi:hypothetical protein
VTLGAAVAAVTTSVAVGRARKRLRLRLRRVYLIPRADGVLALPTSPPSPLSDAERGSRAW